MILQTLIIRLVVSEKGDVEMKITVKQFSRKSGFTIVEMLTAIAIIAVLVSLIIPALSLVHKSADMVRQKAQFHSIGIGLEAFRADFGDYPESNDNFFPDEDDYPDTYFGAQKLAEAMVGQDGFGFHPRSELRRDGLADWDGDGMYEYVGEEDERVYHVDEITDYETGPENLSARKGPYLELETANAVRLKDSHESPISFLDLTYEEFVLADMFGVVRHRQTGKKTGMPILYYRANTLKFKHDPANYQPYADNIYNFNDNQLIVSKYAPVGNSVNHPMWSDPGIFYDNTQNLNFTNPPRPYRSDSFILLSAGPDGLYGTGDDVFNFDEAE
jgi:prepilin-type N-terminal cleavage/methylation domain-containing protein